MKDENKAIINSVINTLNQITVKGKDNMDMLLGCILALEGVLKEDKTDGRVDS